MQWFHKKSVLLLVAVCTVFLLSLAAVGGRHQFSFTEGAVAAILTPLEYAMSGIGYRLRQGTSGVAEIINVYNQNQTLRDENTELRQTGINFTEVVAENMRLRALLDYRKTVPQFDFVTASVVSRDPGLWTNIIVINRGTADGIAKDMPVLTAKGLIGDVIEVYAHSAKVQLLIDPRSAVGAIVQRPESRVAAIVEGDAARPSSPRMVNLARDSDVIKGDKIITSGYGGIYPKGLYIGEVVDIINEEGGLLKYAVLKTGADFDKLEEVLVLIRSREPVPSISVPAPNTKGAKQ